MNDTNEIPPRQYSGYQYQIVFSSYFSAWDRGTWRCTVSTVRRVRSDHGAGGKRETRYPNTFRFSRPIRDSLANVSPAVREVPVAEDGAAFGGADDTPEPLHDLPWGLGGVPHEPGTDDATARLRNRDGGHPAGRGPVGEVRPHVDRPVRMDVPGNRRRVVLRVMATAPDRVLAGFERLRDEGGLVVLVGGGQVLEVPLGEAAQVDASIPDRDDPGVVDEVVRRPLRRESKQGAVHADEEDRESRAGELVPIRIEQRAPQGRAARPRFREVLDLRVLPDEGVEAEAVRQVRVLDEDEPLIDLAFMSDRGRDEGLARDHEGPR